MVLVLKLPAWSSGMPIPSINPDHVARLKSRCRYTVSVCIILLSGLYISHFCLHQIVDVLYPLDCRLCLLLFGIICTDIQFKVTMGVVSKVCKEG